MRYAAFIHKELASCYGVSFPDFPGCISAGDTLDEAVANAAEALQGHVTLMESDGEDVPTATPIEIVMSDPRWTQDRADAVITAVRLIRAPGSTARING